MNRAARVRTIISRQVHRALRPSSLRLGKSRIAPATTVPTVPASAAWVEPAPLRVRDVVRLPAPPPPPWTLGASPTIRASIAVATAREVFARHPEAVDAVLGWLFARFPQYGAAGSDMVVHHAMLRDERYYQGWVTLCTRLQLFEKDRSV